MTTHQPRPHYGAATRGTSSTRARLLPSQIATLVMGVVFVAAGVAGFIVTGFDRFAGAHGGEMLLGLHVNPLHNLVHLLFGIVGLLMWRSVRSSLSFGLLLVVAYGVVLIAGLFAIDQDWNILAVDPADNWLHLAFVVVGALIAGEAARELNATADRREP